MLQEFRVDNFKSLINIVFKPQGANLLLGMNNSGKTNLCQALRFVSGSSLVSLNQCADRAAGGRFGMTNFSLNKSTVDFYVRAGVPYNEEELTFEYELTVSPPANRIGKTAVGIDREVLSVTGGEFDNVILLENLAGRIRLLHEKQFASGTEHYVETTASTDVTMLQRLYDPEANARAKRFQRYLGEWVYYDLSPAAMRGSAHNPRQFIVEPDGRNLASVLYSLKTGNERDYRRLLKVLQEIEPGLDLINFHVGSEDNVFMVFEDSEGHSLPAVNASNGMLRFSALAYVLLVQPGSGLSPLCMVEEPENGIHVDFLKTLFEMVDSSEGSDRSSGRPQVVFTSHAPYFVDLFDEHLGGVFVLKQGQGHTSIVQPDIKAVKARLEHFPLGEQHYREMLG